MIALLRRTTILAVVTSALFVCHVNAQSHDIAPARDHIETATFNGDTVLLHSVPSLTRLSARLAAFINAMPPLPGIHPASPASAVDVYLAENEATFAKLTGGAAPHWGAGIAQPDSGVIVLPAYTSKRGGVLDMGPVIRHELAHVELQRALPGLRIPRWFTEGYAVWTAGELDPDADWFLRVAFLTHRAPPLDSLELDWPAQEAEARVAYLLSASAVAYLHSLGSDAQFDAFLARWKQMGSSEQALRTTYLISGEQLERLWAKHVRKHYGWLLFAAQGAVLWVFITAVAIVLIFVRRRRDRVRLAALKKSEIPDAPAFWMDPEEAEIDASAEAPDVGGGVETAPDGLTEPPQSDKLAP